MCGLDVGLFGDHASGLVVCFEMCRVPPDRAEGSLELRACFGGFCWYLDLKSEITTFWAMFSD